MPRAAALAKNGRGPGGIPRRALSLRQPACKPGSGWRDFSRAAAIPLGRRLRVASSSQPGRLDRRPVWVFFPAFARTSPRRPYSALLPVGFAVPLPSPEARCALTAPFHPYPPCGRRFVFCGTFPGVAPAGRYPAPCLRGARTFLDASRAAAARPTDPLGMGMCVAPVKGGDPKARQARSRARLVFGLAQPVAAMKLRTRAQYALAAPVIAVAPCPA